MVSDFRITVDLKGVLDAAAMRNSISGYVAQAVRETAVQGAAMWKEAVAKAPLWSGERDAYIASISWRMLDEYTAEISSNYKYVEDIETGRPPRDLKKMLDTSMKVRVTKKGQRYLIIPMRHNTPGNTALARAMPDDIYAAARDLQASSIVGHSTRVSGTGAYSTKTKQPYLVRSRKYQWGDRLPEGMAPKLKPHHTTDIYAGMVRMDNTSPGGKRYSSYLTFRIMGEWQTGKWIVPAQPGLYIAKTVAELLQPIASANIKGSVSNIGNAA